jgi:hypothetical protein
MTTSQIHEYDGCLMCAVRALTEGTPPAWKPEQVGEKVTGVVLRKLELTSRFSFEGTYPAVDLWIGGTERIRVHAFGANLRQALTGAEPQVGDTATVRYDGLVRLEAGVFKGKSIKAWTVQVSRGHHG